MLKKVFYSYLFKNPTIIELEGRLIRGSMILEDFLINSWGGSAYTRVGLYASIYSNSFCYRILIGIFCAFVVGLADLYFVIRFLLETEGNIKRPTLPSTLEEDESTTTIAAEKKSGTAVPKSTPTVEKSEPEVSKPKLD